MKNCPACGSSRYRVMRTTDNDPLPPKLETKCERCGYTHSERFADIFTPRVIRFDGT